jgi:hypothetical protein
MRTKSRIKIMGLTPKSYRRWGVVAAVLLFGLLTSCSSAENILPEALSKSNFAVAPLFREFYQDLGGYDHLGAAIAAPFDQDGAQCQYTVNVLMCMNPLISGVGRFYLAPLGVQLGIYEEPDPALQWDGSPVIEGYFIYQDFYKVYTQMRGEAQAGRPLTGIRYNYEQQRIEQYFENLAFYHPFSDPPGTVKLLPYGAAVCAEGCRYNIPLQEMFIAQRSGLDNPFARVIERLGGTQVFGDPLTEAYISPLDGNLEQVYANIIVYSPADQPGVVAFRRLTSMCNMNTTPAGSKLYDISQNMIFYPTEGEFGYHVPVIITSHGGSEVAGRPVAEAMSYPTENVAARQCYENYCLDYDPSAPEGARVHLAPLGKRYLEANPSLGQTPALGSIAMHLQVSEDKPQIPVGEKQTIYLLVVDENNAQPLANLAATVTLTLPDGSQPVYRIQPTGQDGTASIEIQALPNVENGSLIRYQVCLNGPDGSPLCITDAFLIWNVR